MKIIDKSTINFLLAGLRPLEENPTVVLSKDYDVHNRTSPVMSFVLMTFEAEKQLQKALHGEENAVALYPTTGLISTRMIRALYERPNIGPLSVLYSFTQESHAGPARPVEIHHPNIVFNTNPHEMLTYHFLTSWHDRYHAWRASSNLRAFIMYELYLVTHKGVCQREEPVMNRAVWRISDLDVAVGTRARRQYLAKLSHESVSLLITGLCYYIMGFLCNVITEKISVSMENYKGLVIPDLLLLHVIDVRKNPNLWNHFLADMGFGHVDFKKTLLQFVSNENFKNFFPVTTFIRHFVDLLTEDSARFHWPHYQYKSPEYTILSYRLGDVYDKETLLIFIEQQGIENLFVWSNNAGLMIRPEFREHLHATMFLRDLYIENKTQEVVRGMLLRCFDFRWQKEFNTVKKSLREKRIADVALDRQLAIQPSPPLVPRPPANFGMFQRADTSTELRQSHEGSSVAQTSLIQ